MKLKTRNVRRFGFFKNEFPVDDNPHENWGTRHRSWDASCMESCFEPLGSHPDERCPCQSISIDKALPFTSSVTVCVYIYNRIYNKKNIKYVIGYNIYIMIYI